MTTAVQAKQANLLIFLGLLLFLIGLSIGLLVQQMANPRMALSAHLEGVMNGMFLVLLGLIWNRLMLSKFLLKLVFLLTVYGTFANVTATVIAALTGFGKLMPLAGGKEGTGMAEAFISFLLISLSLCMPVVCIIVLMGVYPHLRQSPVPEG